MERIFAVFLHAIVYRLFINLLLFNKRVREEISFINVKKMAHNTKKSRFSRDFFFVASDLLSLKSCIFSLNYTLFNKSAINFQNCVILSILHPFWNHTAASHSLARYFVAEKERREQTRRSASTETPICVRERVFHFRESNPKWVSAMMKGVSVGGARKTIKRSRSRGRGDKRRAMKHIQWRREWVSVCACVDVSLCWF